jgi:NAD(P)-dependent dehydrogenase (short-subunit alcohol dehydrogenase family)
MNRASPTPISPARCVVRATGPKPGRTRWVAPGLTAARHLHYRRIRLAAGDGPLAVDPGAFDLDMPAPPSFGVQLVYTNPAEPELATIVHELTSAASDYVNGHMLVVDGGWPAR